MSRGKGLLFYAGYFFAWTLGIVVAGALLGAISFPLVGAFTHRDADLIALARSGAEKLGFLAFIWAPGTAIVLTFHRVHSQRRDRSRTN